MARRYRPAVFDEVVGQEHIAATLKNAIVRDRVAHAYMFTGGHGCGKTTMARILAKALVCEKGPTPDPCGVCPICVDVAAGRDSDVLEIDGASNNGIEQIRQLREQAAYVPTRARYKIYIIDEVHMLSEGAFNALLKTLEEPPRHVKFILATTDPHKVPDTILSRCQRFDFRLVPQAKLSAFFRRLAAEEKTAITDDALDAVASFAEGSVRDGLVLLDQLLSFADGEVTRRDVESVRGVASAENVAGVFTRIAAADVAAALAIVDEVASRGTNVGDFLDQLIAYGRDLMILTASNSTDGISAYGPARDALLEQTKTTSLEKALLYLDVLTQARTRVRSRALSNPLVALEMAVARLAGLGGIVPVSDILARLDNLPTTPPMQQPARPVPHHNQQTTVIMPQPAAIAETVIDISPPRPMEAEQEPQEPAQREPAPVEPIPEPVPSAPWDEQPGPTPPAEPIPAASAETRVDDIGQPAIEEAAPLSMDEVERRWEAVLDRLAKEHPADLRHMARVSLESVKDGDTLVLAGPPTVLEAWEDKRRQARLAAAAQSVLGRAVRFDFAPRLPRQRQAADAAATSEATFNLTRHPTVDKIKTLFDGVIVACDVKESAPMEEDEYDPEDDA